MDGSIGTQLEQLADVGNLQLERPPMIELENKYTVSQGVGRGLTFGGMRVESARRVMKLILITAPPRQPN